MPSKFSMPEIPKLSKAQLNDAYANRDTLRVSGESLQALIAASVTIVSLLENSQEFKDKRNSVRGKVCLGHLHKGIKLAMAAINLSSTGKYGEGINLLAYQSLSTIVQGIWLSECSKAQFSLYLGQSLVSEKEAYDFLLKSGTQAQRDVGLPPIVELFKSAGLDVETFEPPIGRIPSTRKMVSELGAGHRLSALFDILGFHQVRTTFVDLSQYYFDESDEIVTFKTGHMFPKAYHLSAIGLGLCLLIRSYTANVFELEEAREGLTEYLSEFQEWFETLNDFLLSRPVQKGSTASVQKKENDNAMESKLQHHKLENKELITPFNRLPLSHSSWAKQRLPEVLWAMILIKSIGRSKALDVFRKIIRLFLDSPDQKSCDLTFEGIATFPESFKRQFFAILFEDPKAAKALAHLGALKMIPGISEWPLTKNANSEESWQFLGSCVLAGFDHQSQESTDCRWVKVAAEVATGKMVLRSKDDYREVLEYPNFNDQRSVRPSIRAAELSIGTFGTHFKNEWVNLFWEECFNETHCIESDRQIPTQRMLPSKLSKESLQSVFKKISDYYLENLPSTDVEAEHDSIFGTALFSISLAMQINEHSEDDALGLLGLRTIAESVINLRFLCHQSDPTLWIKFRNYGAGKAKLATLKFEDTENPPHYLPLDRLKLIANEDRWQEFLNIDIGDWSGQDLRTRATKSGTKDIYDRYYEWPSAFAHAQWGAIRFLSFQSCINPLHRFHRLPKLPLALRTVRYDVEILLNELFRTIKDKFVDADFSLSPES